MNLWGHLPLGWLGALSAGVSVAGLSIVRGFARRTGGRWEAEMELRVLPHGQDPQRIDFLGVATATSGPEER